MIDRALSFSDLSHAALCFTRNEVIDKFTHFAPSKLHPLRLRKEKRGVLWEVEPSRVESSQSKANQKWRQTKTAFLLGVKEARSDELCVVEISIPNEALLKGNSGHVFAREIGAFNINSASDDPSSTSIQRGGRPREHLGVAHGPGPASIRHRRAGPPHEAESDQSSGGHQGGSSPLKVFTITSRRSSSTRSRRSGALLPLLPLPSRSSESEGPYLETAEVLHGA